MSKDPRCKVGLPAASQAGDFFSSHRDCSNEDVAMDTGPSFDADCGDEEMMDHDSGDVDVDEDGGDSGLEESDIDEDGQEAGMKSKRPDYSPQAIPHNEIDSPELDTPQNQLGEAALSRKPHVIKFPSSKAGQVYRQPFLGANETYGSNLHAGGTNSIYAPFSSKLEWEIAQWAKNRGLSSTAFTDLLKIEGVSLQFQ